MGEVVPPPHTVVHPGTVVVEVLRRKGEVSGGGGVSGGG